MPDEMRANFEFKFLHLEDLLVGQSRLRGFIASNTVNVDVYDVRETLNRIDGIYLVINQLIDVVGLLVTLLVHNIVELLPGVFDNGAHEGNDYDSD